MESKTRRLKLACYTASVSMSVVANLSPLLFLTFRSLYGISYSLLGLLVLINFFTQLLVDLVFSFFSHKFNIPRVVKIMPALSVLGLAIYALWPALAPETAYIGLVLGTILFSLSSGLAEVLVSPIIAALPSKDPDREMSRFHSVYAWGVVFVVLFSTVFLLVFGAGAWQYLALLLAAIPLISCILYCGAELPAMQTPEKISGVLELLKNGGLWLCVFGIFLGGASECTMAQWCSGYLEQAMRIPKIWGDVLGVALFSVMMGIGRSLYGKIGKHVERVLLLGSVGAALCYLTAAISPWPLVGLLGCAITGFCVSMLWPGSLIAVADRVPNGGVFMYALMAAGGDFGAAIGPQLVGVVTDAAIANATLATMAQTMQLAPEQLGMKLGMLVGMLFPVAAIPIFAVLWKSRKKKNMASR